MTTPVSSSAIAGRAYAAALGTQSRVLADSATGAVGSPMGGTGGVASSGFADLVAKTLEDTSTRGAAAQRMTTDHLNGNTSVVDVVTAISEAELTVQALRSVRDRMLAAYQEISRMPI